MMHRGAGELLELEFSCNVLSAAFRVYTFMHFERGCEWLSSQEYGGKANELHY